MAMTKQKLSMYISDLFADFLYYDRKEDEDFTRDDADNLSTLCTKEELMEMFKNEIDKIYE